MEEEVEVGQGFLYGGRQGGRTDLDVANQHPTCPQVPCQLPPHPMHLMHPFHLHLAIDTPSGSGIESGCLSLLEPSPLGMRVAASPGGPGKAPNIKCFDPYVDGVSDQPGSLPSRTHPPAPHATLPVKLSGPVLPHTLLGTAPTATPQAGASARMLPAGQSCHYEIIQR